MHSKWESPQHDKNNIVLQNLHLKLKYLKFFLTVLTSSLTLIRSPTWLLKVRASVVTPISTNVVNLSLTSGQFHPILKESVISPLPKKPTL